MKTVTIGGFLPRASLGCFHVLRVDLIHLICDSPKGTSSKKKSVGLFHSKDSTLAQLGDGQRNMHLYYDGKKYIYIYISKPKNKPLPPL